jgi:hypothetical protein
LETDFLNDSSLPGWLSAIGTSTTVTHNSIGSDRGELEVAVAGNKGGLEAIAVDGTSVREIRFGYAGRTTLQNSDDDQDSLAVGIEDSQGTSGGNNGAFTFRKTKNAPPYRVDIKEGGTFVTRDVNLDFYTGEPFQIEMRLRPADDYVALLEGDNVVYEQSGEPLGTATYYPSIQLNTANTGDTETVYLQKCWLEIVQN